MEQSIDDVLGQDHQRLDGLFHTLRESVTSGGGAAKDAFGQCESALRHHMQWEEEKLFPAVRQHCTQTERRSIESLEIDHERIRDTLKEIGSAISNGQVDEASRQMEWLESLLKGHNYDEEHGIYEEADRYLDAEARSRLLATFANRDKKGKN